MKKGLLGLGIGAILISVLVVVLWPRTAPSKFSIGPSLPPGKVTPQLVNTWDIAVLLAPDGSLWGWGGTQFGLVHLFSRPLTTQRPQRIGSDSDWLRMAASFTHILALKSDGSLWGLGSNGSGQLAQSNPTNFTAPVRISRGKWLQISVGASHSLALKNDGSLWAWGQNDHGQVGDGTKSNKFTPTLISSERDWKVIEAGAFNSFALKRDGTIWGWGLDPVTGGSTDSLLPQQIDIATNWVAMSAGDYCLLALKSDGTLWLRGQNAHVAASDYAKGSTGSFIQIGSDKNWQEVYAGQGYFFGRKADGSWWVCGSNSSGELGIGSRGSAGSPRRLPFDLDPWAFAPGFANTTLLAKDGTLWSWGTRLGSGRSPMGPPSVRDFLNRISSILFKRRIFKSDDAIIDTQPYRLWELPSDVRRSLGTEVPKGSGQNQSPTNRSVATEANPAQGR
jgi:alpha-tubulin suppressor-like RCC1 family protein